MTTSLRNGFPVHPGCTFEPLPLPPCYLGKLSRLRPADLPQLLLRNACQILVNGHEVVGLSSRVKAQALPKEEFKREVERHLTGKETEVWEIVYFKLYKSQLPVVEKAIETAGLMLGTDKSRGYCLEMICADFLAGANIEESESSDSALAINPLSYK